MAWGKLSIYCLLTLIFLSFCGCGGGGSGSSDEGSLDSNGGTDFSRGVITAFGSIVVNGVTFDVSGAEFEVGDIDSPDDSDLRLGMVVDVTGTVTGTTGVAENVVADELIKGPVQVVASSSKLTIMGQTVFIDAATVVDDSITGRDVTTLMASDLVEVYGHIVGPGQVAATFIEKKASLLEYKVRGFISGAGASTFSIGTLTVDFSGADLSDLPGGVVNGVLVEVEGGPSLGGGSTLTATKVEPERIPAANGAFVELEAVVTQIVDVDTFMLGGLTVNWSASTEFEGGPSSDIAVGVRLEVEGPISNNTLTASEIEFEDAIRLEGDIAAITGNTFTLAELPTLTIEADAAFTDFDGLTDLSDFSPGDQVRARGRRASDGTIVAFELESRSDDDDVTLQGPVTATPSNPIIQVMGINASTAAMDDSDFHLGDDDDGMTPAPLTRAQFFSTATVGTTVKLQGTWNGSAVIWDEATIE